MIVIQPDQNRRIAIDGVLKTVQRPVDIDESLTGFTTLRTLRIYRFEQDSVIEGHAEEDEVYVIVLAGSIELTIEVGALQHTPGPVTLSSAEGIEAVACVAYLPPGAAYRLVASTAADVAYARATPVSIRLPRVFSCAEQNDSPGVTTRIENTTYAERLRFRMLRVDAQQGRVSFSPIQESEVQREQLIHVNALSPAEGIVASTGNGSETMQVRSWDTVAVSPGEHVLLEFAKGLAGVVLVVTAAPELPA